MTASLDSSDPLPLDDWMGDMRETIDQIQKLGLQLVRTHGAASERAAQTSREWQLAARQQLEHEALGKLLVEMGKILAQLEPLRSGFEAKSMGAAAEVIEARLPMVEEAFVTMRHAALDLLLWTRRSGRLEDSPLPDQYRESYGRLTTYSPRLKPWLDGLQQDLLDLTGTATAPPEASSLLSAVSRLNSSLQTARDFVKAVAEPPRELVFHETNLFLADWEKLAVDLRGAYVTSFNDTCECLLYDAGEFERRSQSLAASLPGGLESSLFSFAEGDHVILFAVDDDPLFGELRVTLYRVVTENEKTEAVGSLVDHFRATLGALNERN